MIDLHTHSLLSDGALLPTELIRRAKVLGHRGIAITDHVDGSNIDFVVPRIARICQKLSSIWNIAVIPGAELTHVPLEQFEELIKTARGEGAKLILVHGETLVEPVVPGTNRRALECDIDILTHPGLITADEAKVAAKKNIYLEITSRKGHSLTNGHVAMVARQCGARLIINTDAHSPEDLLRKEDAGRIARGAGLSEDEVGTLFKNSQEIIGKFGF